jgi:hypothetical protein
MNKLIVESKNDTAFVQALVKHINAYAEVEEISTILEFEDLGVGLSEQRLTDKISDVLDEVRKKGVQKIGILIDLDIETIENRIVLVNKCLKKALSNKGFDENTEGVSSINTFSNIKIDEATNIEFACHFTNVDGEGELETVLKKIKNQNSEYADCLESWRTCLTEKGKSVTNKEFDKFWVSNYIRFDTCKNKEKGQAEKKCNMQNFDYVLEKSIFNLDDVILNDLKTFLSLFN